MSENFEHIKFMRQDIINPMRKKPGGGKSIPPPSDPMQQGKFLLEQLNSLKRIKQNDEVGGFDKRFLIKIDLQESINLSNLPKGVELISQEDKKIVLAFATEEALREFEERFTTLARGEIPQYKDIVYALRAIDAWTSEDRKGITLSSKGFPSENMFLLDVELWPISAKYQQISNTFKDWMQENDISYLDSLISEYLIIFRVEVDIKKAHLILSYRDVRVVDIPPQYAIEQQTTSYATDAFQCVPNIHEEIGIAILDTGIYTNHPLLAPAVGEAISCVDGLDSSDTKGHGTSVASIALYGDISECIKSEIFIPQFRIFGAKIIDDTNGSNDSLAIIKRIEKAVEYFTESYNVKIFNLSIGDSDKIYNGKHIRDLSVFLDMLSREKNILFIVSTGNYTDFPSNNRYNYPNYLLSSEARLLEPATAINVLTVGSIARYTRSPQSERYPSDPRFQSIAPQDHPSPFTRCGPSINSIIKPDLVAYGGNLHISLGTDGYTMSNHLGEICLSNEYITGKAFCTKNGTSFAAPYIAHLAAHILKAYPKFSVNLIRALLTTKAHYPDSAYLLFEKNEINKSRIIDLYGYGSVNLENLITSSNNEIIIYADDSIEDEKHHFYELPIPNDFYEYKNRSREITVTLAYMPAVKTTRIDYKMSNIYYTLVEAKSLEEVAQSYKRQDANNQVAKISEFDTNRNLSSDKRSKGTVQSSTWKIKDARYRKNKRFFVVVTRQDAPWAKDKNLFKESYALIVSIKDSYGDNIQLYSKIRNLLRLQTRIRV